MTIQKIVYILYWSKLSLYFYLKWVYIKSIFYENESVKIFGNNASFSYIFFTEKWPQYHILFNPEYIYSCGLACQQEDQKEEDAHSEIIDIENYSIASVKKTKHREYHNITYICSYNLFDQLTFLNLVKRKPSFISH